MPKVNWDDVPDADDYTPLKDGEYICECMEVEESMTRNNDVMWTLKFKVTEGEGAGRFIWDRITFSDNGLSRVKLVFSRLGGIKPIGEMELVTSMLIGKSCKLVIYVDEYMDKFEQQKKSNKVHFDGYLALESTEEDPF